MGLFIMFLINENGRNGSKIVLWVLIIKNYATNWRKNGHKASEKLTTYVHLKTFALKEFNFLRSLRVSILTIKTAPIKKRQPR